MAGIDQCTGTTHSKGNRQQCEQSVERCKMPDGSCCIAVSEDFDRDRFQLISRFLDLYLHISTFYQFIEFRG